jgi:hypothetical protein
MFYTNLGKERLQQNLQQMYNIPTIDIQAINGLNKAEELGLLDYDATDIEKGRKGMPIGSKAVWGGVSYLKTAQGWKPVGKHRGNVKENHDLIHNNDDKDKDHHAMVMDAGKMDEKEWTAKHGSNLHSKYKQVHEYLHKEKEGKPAPAVPENKDEYAGLTAQERNGVKVAEHIKKLAGEAKSAMDRFLERKKLTIEDYNKMDKKDQDKLNEEWRNSPEYSDTDIKEKESKPKEEKKEEKPAEAKPEEKKEPEAKKEEPKVETKKEESKPVLSKTKPIEVHAPALGHLPAIDYTLKYDQSNFMFDVYQDGKKKGVMNEKQVLSNIENGHFKIKDTPAEAKPEPKKEQPKEEPAVEAQKKKTFDEFSEELDKPKDEDIHDMEIAILTLKQKYDKLNGTSTTPYGDELARSFPMARVGFQSGKLSKIRDKELERTIQNASNSIKIEGELKHLESRLKNYKAGKVNLNGQPKALPIGKLKELVSTADAALKSGVYKDKQLTAEEKSSLKEGRDGWKKQLTKKEKEHKAKYEEYIKG